MEKKWDVRLLFYNSFEYGFHYEQGKYEDKDKHIFLFLYIWR